MFKIVLIASAAMVLATPAVAQEATTLTVRTTTDVSSASAKVGDAVTFTVDGQPDATAYGSVIDVRKRGAQAKSGSITVQVRYVRAGERRTHVNGIVREEARASTGTRIAAAGIGGLFIKGKNAVIAAGTPINVTVED
jgi:hypothetical protein